MAMEDEQPLQLSRWSLQLQRGEGLTLPPGDDEPFVVTDVFLVDPESAAGQGVVSAYVEMGTQKIMLAQLSSEVKAVELDNPLVLDDEFRFYVMPSDTNTDEDAVFVQFKGFMVSLPLYDTDDESEEEEEEGDEEDASSEDDETDEDDEEGVGEIDGDVAAASSVGGTEAKDVDGLQLEHA